MVIGHPLPHARAHHVVAHFVPDFLDADFGLREVFDDVFPLDADDR
jgi:hypothetical protein